MNKFIISLMCFVLMLSFGATTDAATVKQEISGTSTLAALTVPIADVNLGDVRVSEENGVYKGIFSLEGRMGLETDISYGIVAYDSNYHIVDVKRLGEEPAIREGSVFRYSFSYTPPKTLSGKISFTLEAYTKEGLRTAVRMFASKTFTGNGNIVQCTTTSGTLICIANRAGTVNTELYSGSIFKEPQQKIVLNLKAGEKITPSSLFPQAVPGIYRVAFGQAGAATALYPYTVAGSYASIQNVAVSRTDGVIHAIGFVRSKLSKPTVQGTFLASDSRECMTVNDPFDGITFDLTLPETCTEGTYALKIIGNDGKVYDTIEGSYSVLSKGTDSSGNIPVRSNTFSMQEYLFFALVIAGILALYGGIQWWQKRKRIPEMNDIERNDSSLGGGMPTALMVLFLATAVFAIGTPRAHALSLINKLMDAGEIAHVCSIGISGDSSVYPGGTMTLTASTDVWFDVEPQGYSAWSCSVAWRPDLEGHNDPGTPPLYDAGNVILGGAPAWGGVSANRTMDTWAGDSKIEDYTFPVYSNMAAGQHTLTLRLLIASSNFQGNVDNKNWTFTVNPVTVNVFFTNP